MIVEKEKKHVNTTFYTAHVVRQNTIFKLPANVLNITTLLQGDRNISNNMNSLIFKAVLDFIAQSGRFAMGDKLN